MQPVVVKRPLFMAGMMAVRTMMVRSNGRVANRMPQPVMVFDPPATLDRRMFRMLRSPAIVGVVVMRPATPVVRVRRMAALMMVMGRGPGRIHREGRWFGGQGRKRCQRLAVRCGG